MSQFDSTLKMYADSGLRTMADWAERGRDIKKGSSPRTDTQRRGVVIELYTRDQTLVRPQARAQKTEPPATAIRP